MDWKLLSRKESEDITSTWANMSDVDFASLIKSWDVDSTEIPDEYIVLKKALYDEYNKVLITLEDKHDKNYKLYCDRKKYFFDLLFGWRLYNVLGRYNFGVRLASNDQVWAYLSIKVLPKIVYERYHTDEQRINLERFFKSSRRIYLKAIWWYIYLTGQKGVTDEETFEKTFEVLKENGTDDIVQLVERCGPEGYRVEVYREIAKKYASIGSKRPKNLLRKVMVLNTARTALVEPQLTKGGVQGYVENLFKYFGY